MDYLTMIVRMASQPFMPWKDLENFPGQRWQVIHPKFIETARHHPLMSGLFPTAIGSFPSARGHHVVRENWGDDLILIVCTGGKGFCEMAGRHLEIIPGTGFLIPGRQPHSYGADPEQPWSISWLQLRGGDCGSITGLLGVSVEEPRFHLPQTALFQDEFEQALDALQNAQAAPQFIFACAHLRRLMSQVALQRQPVNRRSRTAEENVAASPAWMRKHLSEPNSLERLARAAMLSPSHYSSLFRKRFGCSPVEFWIRLKIEEACRWLDQTALPISAIAGKVGYEDVYYFSRLFKKITGRSPARHRKLPKG
ncbi:MAG: AraC family transcriptional regulator [Terrimicrobiaceae bacterium]